MKLVVCSDRELSKKLVENFESYEVDDIDTKKKIKDYLVDKDIYYEVSGNDLRGTYHFEIDFKNDSDRDEFEKKFLTESINEGESKDIYRWAVVARHNKTDEIVDAWYSYTRSEAYEEYKYLIQNEPMNDIYYDIEELDEPFYYDKNGNEIILHNESLKENKDNEMVDVFFKPRAFDEAYWLLEKAEEWCEEDEEERGSFIWEQYLNRNSKGYFTIKSIEFYGTKEQLNNFYKKFPRFKGMVYKTIKESKNLKEDYKIDLIFKDKNGKESIMRVDYRMLDKVSKSIKQDGGEIIGTVPVVDIDESKKKKNNKRKERVRYVGNPQREIELFNHMMGSDTYANASDSSEGGEVASVSMGESFKEKLKSKFKK